MTRLTAIARWAERAMPGETITVKATEPGGLGGTPAAHWAACALVHGGWAVCRTFELAGRWVATLQRTSRAWDARGFRTSLGLVNGTAFKRGEAMVCAVCGGPVSDSTLWSGTVTCSAECARAWRAARLTRAAARPGTEDAA